MTIPISVTSLVGARPQFVKLAPIHRELSRRGIGHRVIHSGQHYDDELSHSFFEDLGLPEPSVNLEVGSGNHADQTARIMERLDAALDQSRTDIVLIYGDTNTTLAGALVVSKRTEYLVHIEAGLRSFNHRMPEEVNRTVADHLSHLLLAPTNASMGLLANEGLQPRARLVGDVMVDALRAMVQRVSETPPVMPPQWQQSEEFILATLHRAENTDDPDRLQVIIDRLGKIHSDVRLAAHPRLVAQMKRHNIHAQNSLSLWPPLTYPQTVCAITRARAVVTDSGGLQKEAALLGCPCLTVRFETEWPETLKSGWNVLDPNLEMSLSDWIAQSRTPISDEVFGDGRAAERIVDAFLEGFVKSRG